MRFALSLRNDKTMAYFLTGSFNHWRPDDPNFRFQEVTDPYGDPRADLTLSLGSYFLKTQFPRGPLQFKIVENGSWERQWTVNLSKTIDSYQFETRHGLKPNYIIFHGPGNPPHALYDYPGGDMRWDFHPESRTLTIHSEFNRTPGVRVQPWEWFDCGEGVGFQTYFGLPYGYTRERAAQCSTSIIFDGRGLIYGEDSNFNVWNEPRRQWLRSLDTLSRHGIIAPTVAIAVAPPMKEKRIYRQTAYLETESDIHRRFTETICTKLLTRIKETFGVSDDAATRYLLGHSNGADIALTLLTHASYANLFGGAVAHSPGGARKALTLPASLRSRSRIALSYTSEDLNPAFVMPTANTRVQLDRAGIQHLMQYIPDAVHDPASLHHHLHPSFAFVMR
jgi:hypothetical protein